MAQVTSLILRLTERCNLACAYCYASACPAGAAMERETALRAVALCCPEGGALRIQFTGGEPLLALPVMEAVHAFGRATGRRLCLSVQTNGTLLTPEVCRRLKAMDCAVGVSLDGLGPANALRPFPDGRESFPAAVEGIRRLGAHGIRCGLTTVVTSANAALLGQLPDLALWLGNVTGVGLDLFRPLGRGKGQELSPAEADLETGLRALLRKTLSLQRAGIPFRLREAERFRKRRSCGCDGIYCCAQTDCSLAVDPRGDCWPCSSLAGEEECFLGNLREGLPARAREALPLAPPESCRACPSFSLCGGGCPAGRSPCKPAPLTCLMQRVLAGELKGDLCL